MNRQDSSEGFFRFLIILIFLAAAIETDIYLPAFPDMMVAFKTNELMIQRILSFNFIGICLASLFYGPAADSFGRRKVLNFGYSLFVVGSFGCIQAATIECLIFWRFLQGLGSAACFIVGTAVVFDRYHAEKAAKMVGEINSLVVTLMAFAPMLGGWLNHLFGYQFNFLFIAALSSMAALACFLKLPETLAESQRKPFRLRAILTGYKTVLQNFGFWVNSMIMTLIFSAYMIYVSNLSLIFVNHLGVNEAVFPWYQFSILAAFVVASLNMGRLTKRFGLEQIISGGGLLMLLSVLTAWAGLGLWQDRPLVLNAFMGLYSLGSGCCFGIFFTRSMEACPELKGISSSLLTAVRLIVASLLIDVTALMFDGTMQPVMLMIGLCMLISFGLYAVHRQLSVKRRKASLL